MRMKDIMTKNPVTVDSETSILDARRIMKEKNIRRLPVLEEGKLVGIVTKRDLDEAAPPPTTSTSAHEFHSIISKMKIKEAMKKNLVTLTPETPFEEALKIGQKNKISSFLIVEDGRLVGITTESDILRFLARVLGLEQEGSRITIEGLGGTLGVDLKNIISIVEKNKTILLSMLSLPRSERKDWIIVLRVKTKDPAPIVAEFKKEGFNVTYVA